MSIVCDGCKVEIKEGGYASIGKKNFHQDCFKCNGCKNKLVGGYIEDKGEFLCEECYSAANLQKCSKCNEFIKDAMVNVGGSNYHATCFVCVSCGKGFPDGKYSMKDNNPMCLPCAEQASEFTCAGCDKKIVGKKFQAVEKDWHPQCFKCPKCDKQIASSFKVVEGKAYHPDCMQNICAACHKGCQNEYYQVDNGDFIHKDCMIAYKAIQANKQANENK